MTALLASLLGKISGSALLVPGLLLALIIAGHQLVKAHDDKIQLSAKQQCDTSWLAATFKRQVEAAMRETAAQQTILEEERKITERLNHDLQETRRQLAELRDTAPPALDSSRCLSDGVLELLRRRQGVVGSGKGAGGS